MTTSKQKNILFLTLDCFNSTGGVQKVCRTLCFTLAKIAQSTKSAVVINSLYDHEGDYRYVPRQKYFAYGGRRFDFVVDCFRKGIRSDTIILSHINLLVIAVMIKLIKRNTDIILLVHGTEAWRKQPAWKKIFLKCSVSIWSVSNYTKARILQAHNLPDEKVQVVNNSLDPFFVVPKDFSKPDELLARYGLNPKQSIILTISRMTKYDREKGYEQVLRLIPGLLDDFPDIKYLIAGAMDIDEADHIQNLINNLGIRDQVLLLGYIPEDELFKHYLLSDIFILPSKKEGFGLVFIEAAACGCNIVSGNKDGSVDATLNGKLGISIDPDNNAEIRSALLKLLKTGKTSSSSSKIQSLCIESFSQFIYQKKIEALLL